VLHLGQGPLERDDNGYRRRRLHHTIQHLLVFEGTFQVNPTQNDAVQNSLVGKLKAGDVVIVRLEGSKGGPSEHAMLCLGCYVKSQGLGKAYALLADGRFSSGRSSLSIDHCSLVTKARGALPFPGPARRVCAPCRLRSRAAHFVN
jgi:hypothetical protein